jgi:hydrogenase nickel incorporation protein HypB
MCTTCGCSQPADAVTIQLVGEEEHLHFAPGQEATSHTHPHHGHGHVHTHGHSSHAHSHHSPNPAKKTVLQLELDILQKNQLLAERNRGFFEARNILALNFVSSPGAGKTSLLERTLRDLKTELPISVIEGDQQTMNDAKRIAETGAPVVQINTGKGCHLDAEMITHALKKLNPAPNSILAIENVGNLVCPALFDLGEHRRIVVISVPEGDDKPIKYPDMFHSAHLCIINKIDLLPYVTFSVEKARQYALQVNHHLEFIELSATSGQGLDDWYQWLRNQSDGLVASNQ